MEIKIKMKIKMKMEFNMTKEMQNFGNSDFLILILPLHPSTGWWR